MSRPPNGRQVLALQAVARLEAEYRSKNRARVFPRTSEVARAMGVAGHYRHGNGAVKGSWSGRTSPASALASTMQALARRGLVLDVSDFHSHRAEWMILEEGRKMLENLPGGQ